MRVDIVSIFPDYLAPLSLSLPGRARERGLLDLHVHDLRRWTHDRHRTVDDSPYGGGAGMVMKPEPWGEALDELTGPRTVLVVPTPSGTPLSQALAEELAGEAHLVVACGRYEGIDQRVVDHYTGRLRVREVSLGDYVLNGGEAAALVLVEAVVRLLPGFMGNPGSLAEESHGESGLLEYPVYTKPAVWRGLAVPEVLLGGHHGQIAAWRHEQALRRTLERRPDLAHASRALTGADLPQAQVGPAEPADLGEIWTLQWACFEGSSRLTQQTLAREVLAGTTLVVRSGGRLVATVRGRLAEDGRVWELGLLMVVPDLRRRGLGRALLRLAEEAAPSTVESFRLVTPVPDDPAEDPLPLFRRAGYSVREVRPGPPETRVLGRPARRR